MRRGGIQRDGGDTVEAGRGVMVVVACECAGVANENSEEENAELTTDAVREGSCVPRGPFCFLFLLC